MNTNVKTVHKLYLANKVQANKFYFMRLWKRNSNYLGVDETNL